MIRKVKTAVIGCGRISSVFHKNFKEVFSIIDVVGCCDLDPRKAASCAAEYGIEAMTMEQICADESIELAVNLTNPAAHYSVIKQLLLAGKHVYTEKVLAVELEQAKELVQLAEEQNLYLGAAPDTFLGGAMQTARRAVELGLIGTVTSCIAYVQRDYRTLAELMPFVAQPGGGIGLDVGIYYITAMESIFGSAKTVCGIARQEHRELTHLFPRDPSYGSTYASDTETVVSGSILFQNGVIGTVQFNAESVFPEQPAFEIIGSEGILSVPDPNRFDGTVYIRTKGSAERLALPCSHGFLFNARGLGAAEMAWAMRAGRCHRANHKMAYHALETLWGILHSSKTGTYYELSSTFEQQPPLPAGLPDSSYLHADPEAALV